MFRITAVLALALLPLAACSGAGSGSGEGVYRIGASDATKVQQRMLDSVNYLRQAKGVAPLTLDPRLTIAAQQHADDMSYQQRAWAFGSDQSNPYTRMQATGFPGALVGEMYSETYETELETLTAWVKEDALSKEILSADATSMGFAWHQDANGLIWWDMMLGDVNSAGPAPLDQ